MIPQVAPSPYDHHPPPPLWLPSVYPPSPQPRPLIGVKLATSPSRITFTLSLAFGNKHTSTTITTPLPATYTASKKAFSEISSLPPKLV